MNKPLRVLMVEDSEDDVLLTVHALEKGGYKPEYERVEDAGAMRKALEKGSWDVILCDYQMPKFNGPAAIALLKETGVDTPLIIVSGAIGEETAVECMRLGACDFFMKGKLSRLAAAVERELKEVESRIQRKRSEAEALQSRQEWEHIFQAINHPTVILDPQHGIIAANKAVLCASGLSRKELLGRKCYEIFHGKNTVAPPRGCPMESLLASGKAETLTREMEAFGGFFLVSCTPILNKQGEVEKIIHITTDINERKRAEEAIKESEKKFRALFENMASASCLDEIIYENGKAVDYRIVDVNPAFEKIIGVIKKDTVGKRASTLYGGGEIPFLDAYIKVAETGQPISFEAYFPPINRYLSITASCPGKGKFSTVFSDITERKGMEAKQKQQIDAMEAAIDGMAILDQEGEYVYLNKAHTKIYGYENAEELIGKSWRVLYDSDDLQRFDQEILPDFIRKGSWHGEALGLKKDGSKFPQEVSLTALEGGGLICIVRDVTERKLQETAMRESEERFRTVFERSTIGKSLTSPDGQILQINKAFADMLGYMIDEIQQINFAQITHPDDVTEGLECIRILLAGEQTAYRMEKRYIHKSGDIVWVDLSTILLRDQQGTPLHLITSIVDITQRKRSEKQLEDTLENLRKAVGTTIQVMVSAVETRDPYTSGHQTRSADLARAIAAEMELPQDQIEGIRMAGSIHDIGKLSIPAEILSKPAKLSEIEFSLIKEHARRGYEILKDVESPWPLAEIVYQHHERVDGSGYPRNLKGEGILMAARILSVADVVEAMASHRPYRPGLGIDAALSEIEKNRGIFYDSAVADACLSLFREKGYRLH